MNIIWQLEDYHPIHMNNLWFTPVSVRCEFSDYLFLIINHWIMNTLQIITDVCVFAMNKVYNPHLKIYVLLHFS